MKRKLSYFLALCILISAGCSANEKQINNEAETSSSSAETSAGGTTAKMTTASSGTTSSYRTVESSSGTGVGSSSAASEKYADTSAESPAGETEKGVFSEAAASPGSTFAEADDLLYDYINSEDTVIDAGDFYIAEDSVSEMPAADSSYGEAFDYGDGCCIDIDIAEPYRPQRRAGLLTGGEWNDNENFTFWADLIGQRSGWTGYSTNWRLYSLNRTKVHVTDKNGDAENVTVILSDDENDIWTAVTDNTGTAYLFYSVDPKERQLPTHISVLQNGQSLGEFEYSGKSEAELVIKAETTPAKNLDLMFVVDTTGSMGDELSYLQTELTGVIERVMSDQQVKVRLCTEFYRDYEDDYTVKSGTFNLNTASEIEFLNKQYSSGGGDYPEAVVEALEAAIRNQSWDPKATQLMFLILDAPPHYTEENVAKLRELLADAAAKGIRIIPVAASGTDEETEFLCRSFALLTGGTYTFLTDHSGIGNSHLEPTVGYYQVEKLNDMLVRIIESYLK